ncbi:uncharacterized protein TNCV_2829491 [Trichonephila clavipes]|nr:uncharacterized protein TNCV_2829491 [Trichonephila clavipes]
MITSAISATTVTKVISTPHLRLPHRIRELIKIKNRFRKQWQLNPLLKREVNSLQRQIKTQISEHRNNSWQNLLTNLHPEDNSLYNLQRKLVKKPTIIPPLAGRNGILYSDDEKAEEFKNNLEATFQENAEPYNDQIIELVESETSDFLANSNTTAHQSS